MGGGSFSTRDFVTYSKSAGKSYDVNTGYVTGQVYKSRSLDPELNPKNVIRECVNSSEHPNTIPVILALDVTGSMGGACKKTAEALGVIMTNLYKKFNDIEFLVMGIGDMEYDSAPVQASQFESDVRIAKQLDKIYMEHGGGGNNYESYTAAWYFGLYHTKLDCFDKQGKKGIIITMGDEPLNPFLPRSVVNEVFGDNVQSDVVTSELYDKAFEKFDIFHIGVDDEADSFKYHQREAEELFKGQLGDRYKVATLNSLPVVIEKCIEESVKVGCIITKHVEDSILSVSDGITW